jgi:hypothetical protein
MSQKYPRTLHAHISKGTTSDDRFMPKGHLKAFVHMKEVVLTEKLDGQNNCFSKEGLFARSHAASSNLPWDKPMRERWELIKNNLGTLELFGENMYGIHSIAYSKLDSFFYLFAVRDGTYWLSWQEVKEVARLFDFPTVPEIKITTPLAKLYKENISENKILSQWFENNLGMSWETSVETGGLLGGYSPHNLSPASEGFVVRNQEGFESNKKLLDVAPNEFDHLFKVVRQGHVQTNIHWTKNWKISKLIDYQRYGWYGYEYLSKY